MKTYRLKPDSWPGPRVEGVSPAVIFVALAVCIVAMGFIATQAFLRARTIRSALIVAGILVLAAALVWLMRAHRIWWRTFEIVVDGDQLVHRAAYSRPLRFVRGDIAQVAEGAGGSVIVRGRDGRRMIVPSCVEHLAELRSTVEEWAKEGAGRRTSGSS